MKKSLFLLTAAVGLALAPSPAHASWKGFCGWVVGLASSPPPQPGPTPPATELDVRLERLFRDKRRDIPGDEVWQDTNLAQMNAELIARHGMLYGRKASRGPEVFTQGVAAERLFLVVHQAQYLQRATIEFLAHRDTFGIPVLALGGDIFPIGDPILAQRISLLQVSHGGEMYGMTFNTSELHLAGGYFGLCLNMAAQDAVTSMLSYPDRMNAKIILHSSLVYTTIEHSLKDAKAQLPADTYLDLEKAVVEDFLPEAMRWRQLDTPGYVFQNRAGQKITIEISTP